jgi:thiol-disulfide isomerase/thioredoxin
MTALKKRLTRGAGKLLPWLLVLGVGYLAFGPREEPRGLDPGSEAPALVADRAEGAPFRLEEERGHVTALVFWATWCPACREEGPMLSHLEQRLRREGGEDTLIGISLDREDPASIERSARRLGMRYPIARSDTRTAQSFGVRVLPSVVIVDAEGRIRESLMGPASEHRIEAAIEAARQPL